MDLQARRRFIHLSDIHFNNRTAAFGFDPDVELRNAVKRDITYMRDQLGNADGILVSGDIAFAGKREEFENAARWLDEVCLAAGCGTEAVFLCPGNHDVDRSVIENNPLIQDGHDAVRRATNLYQQDKALAARLVQPDARALFYSPVTAYNEFAARYQSSFFADATTYVWEHDFSLNDGSTLRLRGLNTALLSGLADVERALFLGSRAWTLPKHSGVEYLIMAHHPPSWLADGKEAERAFEGTARIHLFGHEHEQRVVPGRDWIKLFAGSINPHRAEPNWRPGYNVIDVWVEQNVSRLLKVEVHAREWQGMPPQFRAVEDVGHNLVFHVDIRLPDLPAAKREVLELPCQSEGLPEPEKDSALTEAAMIDPQHRFRLVVFRFFRLSLSKKNEIVGHMRLAEESDSRLTDVERFKLSLVRARERELMDEFEAMIDRLEKEQ